MSYFESVWVKLVCERCGKVHDTVVRFRSFAGRPDGEYELMEVVEQQEGLPRGEVWEGNGDRYCPSCFQKWAEAQAYAGYDALAELVEKGLVTVRAKGSSTPLTRSEIAEYSETYASECREEGVFPVTIPYFEELDLTIGDKPYDPDYDLDLGDESKAQEAAAVWSEFLDLIDPLISERMKNAGWVADETWEDFGVSLNDQRRVVVEDMEGKRLTRDGARIAQ
jgi:hypothetical protein